MKHTTGYDRKFKKNMQRGLIPKKRINLYTHPRLHFNYFFIVTVVAQHDSHSILQKKDIHI